MLLRRIAPAALALAGLAACEPEVPHSTNPTSARYAAFDLSLNPPEIPLPNQLALLPSAIATQTGAQKELLQAFAKAGGFPNDQEVPITIDFVQIDIDPGTGAGTRKPLGLDLNTIVFCPAANCTVAVMQLPSTQGAPPTFPPLKQPTAADYDASSGDHGTLTLHRQLAPIDGNPANGFSQRWAPGNYAAVVRGGTSGIKAGGQLINPQPTMFLLLQDKDLSKPENQGLLPGPSRADKQAQGAQLEQIRGLYLSTVFPALPATGFSKSEIATLTTFPIAPAVGTARIDTDQSAGKLPLPFDALLDPSTGKVRDLSPLVCTPPTAPCAASIGLSTLDGFSTTAMILAPLHGTIDATTVTPGTVLLYEFNGTTLSRIPELKEQLAAPPGTVKAGFVAEPPQLTQSAGSATVSTVIGLQPAVAVDLPPPFAPARIPLPPLKDSTEYAVIVTDGVKDYPTGQPLQTSTLQKILLFSNPLVDASGKSLVGGVDNATASGLEKIRQAVGAAVAKAQADGKIADKSHVVAAYTFKTQSITGRSAFATPPGPSAGVQIAAIPYTALLPGVCAALAQALGLPANTDCTKPLPGSTKVYTAAGAAGSTLTDAFDKYGVDRAVFGGAATHIDAIIETKIVTVNKLDDATGAFKSDPAAALPEVINVLLAVPAAGAANTAQCSGPLAGLAPATCLPVAIWHHGLGGSRASVLTVAETLTGAGLAIAATDAPKHGDRSFCSALNSLSLTGGATKDIECRPGNFCVPDPALAGGSTDPVADPAHGIPVSGAPGRCHTADSLTAPLATSMKNQPALCIGSGPSDCTNFVVNAGTPLASGEYFISANFFRTRDTIRQDTIDFAQLIQVLEPAPAANIPGHDVYNALIARGLVLIPDVSTGTGAGQTGHTYWAGQSLGGILGTINTAVNPRISRAALNVPGGTLVDAFTTAPSFKAQVDALFLSLGVDRNQLANPAVAAKYLQIISLAKWILDPADPINYAGHITTDPLPNLLGPGPLGGNQNGTVAQIAKGILVQVAACDRTVPNPYNVLLAGDAGLSPILNPALATPGGNGKAQYFVNPNSTYTNATATDPQFCPAGKAVPHGFFTSWGRADASVNGTQADLASLTLKAQTSAATFLQTGADQPALVNP